MSGIVNVYLYTVIFQVILECFTGKLAFSDDMNLVWLSKMTLQNFYIHYRQTVQRMSGVMLMHSTEWQTQRPEMSARRFPRNFSYS